jgi:hypothetical protein
MWDPTEFYDDLEHSIFKNNADMRDQSWFMTLCRCYGVTKQAWNIECSTTVATIMTEVFLSLNLLRSEML